jgi:uncharacterized cupin superfamily protein
MNADVESWARRWLRGWQPAANRWALVEGLPPPASPTTSSTIQREHRMHAPILNLADVDCQPRPVAWAAQGEAAARYDARTGAISARLGARQLGYNLTVVPPGKRAFPFHNHHANEEMFLVLEGHGELRLGDARWPVRRGDVIACPAGGRESAHQLINTADTELRYLAVSTCHAVEVCEYPDSDKYAVTAQPRAEGPGQSASLRAVARAGASLDYWEGE